MNLENWKLKNPKFILDWDEVEKGMMISYVSIAITAWDLLSLTVVYFICNYLNISPEHRIADFGYQYSMIAGSIYGFLCVLSLVVGSFLRQAPQKLKNFYMYMGMSVYAIGNIIVIHMFGELSTTSGIILAGAPIVGWVLFETRGVILATLVGVVGVLCTYDLSLLGITPYAPLVEPGYFAHENIAYLITLGAVIAPHLASLLFLSHRSITHWKQREAEANYLAGIDSLTNIPNRRQIRQILQQAISHGITSDEPTAVAMFDLDNFKQINDQYGHHVGDQVLNNCVEIIQNNLRPQDQLGRLGGDEFFLVLPNSSQQDAIELAQRCLDKLRSSNITIDNISHPITASFGVLALPNVTDNDASIRQLMEDTFIKVDKALYEAKQNGRNQIIAT